MPVISKLARLEIAVDDNGAVGAQATYREFIQDGADLHSLGTRTTGLPDPGTPEYAVVVALIGEAVAASTADATAAKAKATKLEAERDSAAAERDDAKQAIADIGAEVANISSIRGQEQEAAAAQAKQLADAQKVIADKEMYLSSMQADLAAADNKLDSTNAALLAAIAERDKLLADAQGAIVQ